MKIDLAKSGYRTLSKNISEFAKINEMPIPLDIRRIDEGDGISVGAVELFLVNLNDNGISERLVSGG
jgi:hypothetical protein